MPLVLTVREEPSDAELRNAVLAFLEGCWQAGVDPESDHFSVGLVELLRSKGVRGPIKVTGCSNRIEGNRPVAYVQLGRAGFLIEIA